MTEPTLEYRRLFDPSLPAPPPKAASGAGFGDRREAAEYVYTEQIVLAVNVAMATTRPLLVLGPAGSGKSSLAPDIARRMGWDLYPEVISSRTEAKDLLWRFDALRRLRDAQIGDSNNDLKRYVRPGTLWRAFDPKSAADFEGAMKRTPLNRGAVVLLDEIDKAEPDTPNDLLVPLGAGTFTVTDVEPALEIVNRRTQRPLVVITSNRERDLPPAFVRRCVALQLQAPSAKRLVAIATAHFGAQPAELHERLWRYFRDARRDADRDDVALPSTAEYLDAVYAAEQLGIGDEGVTWQALMDATLTKWRDGGVA